MKMKKKALLGAILCLFLVGIAGCGYEQNSFAVNPIGNPNASSEQREQSPPDYAPTNESATTSGQREQSPLVYTSVGEPTATSEQGIVTASHTANDFVLSLFSDREVYSTTDAIPIRATLEYVGNDDTVEIWHGLPFITFAIEGNNGFSMNGMVADILVNTVLQSGYVYHFDFQKGGSWDADAQDADFWENFFAEEDLFLPAGEYTITAIGAFSFGERTADTPSGLRSEIRIRVE